MVMRSWASMALALVSAVATAQTPTTEPPATEPSATQPPAATPLEPPGRGIVDRPCPAMRFPRPEALAEPGRPARYGPDYGRAYLANLAYQKANDWNFLCRYRAANAALAGKPAPRVVFMGDSITEGWESYDPAFFAAGNVDRGISGQTTPQMLGRFYADVVALRPAIVHIMGGTNDIGGNTGPSSPEDVRDNIRAMVDLARANGIRVVLATIPPAARIPRLAPQDPRPRIRELNDWLRAYARERDIPLADYHAALATPEGAMRPEYSFDGLHPTTAGYRAMRPIAERAIAAAARGPAPPRR